MTITAILSKGQHGKTKVVNPKDKTAILCPLLIAQHNKEKSSYSKHSSIFQGAAPTSLSLTQKMAQQTSFRSHKIQETAAKCICLNYKPHPMQLIPRSERYLTTKAKDSSSSESGHASYIVTSKHHTSLLLSHLSSGDAADKQLIIDSSYHINPRPFLDQLCTIQAHSEEEQEILASLQETLNAIHNNDDLDTIVEKANLYYAIKVLVNQLIRQTEEQARDILRVIKERKKDIDALGDLVSAFTMAKGEVDFSKDARLIEMIDRARCLGIAIPPDKYVFTQGERDDLLKSIEMKRQSIESINQTTMIELQEKQSRYNSMFELGSTMLKALNDIIKGILDKIARQS